MMKVQFPIIYFSRHIILLFLFLVEKGSKAGLGRPREYSQMSRSSHLKVHNIMLLGPNKTTGYPGSALGFS